MIKKMLYILGAATIAYFWMAIFYELFSYLVA